MHYIMGGVNTDIDGRPPSPGPLAAGEMACVSVHGGNRLGANSLLDTLIFGRRWASAPAGGTPPGDVREPPPTRSPTRSVIVAIIDRRPTADSWRHQA